MSKIIKKASNEDQVYTLTNRIMNFTLEKSLGVVDLNASYVLLTMPQGLQGAEADSATLYELRYPNSESLFENFSWVSDNGNTIDSMNKMNVLTSTLHQINNDDASLDIKASVQQMQPYSGNNSKWWYSANPPTGINCQIMVPFKQFMRSLGKEMVDMNKVCNMNTTLTLRLDNTKSTIRQIRNYTDLADANKRLLLTNLANGDPRNIVYTDDNTYTSDAVNPKIFAGMAVTIRRTITGGATGNEDFIVTAVARTAGNRLVISLNGNLAAGALTNMYLIERGAANIPLTISRAEVVLYQKNGLKKDGMKPGALTYTSFDLEEYTFGATNKFTYQYNIPADCSCVALLTPTNEFLMSQENNLTSYRNRIAEEDTTDRNVDYNGPLYKDRMYHGLLAMGEKIENLDIVNRVVHDGEPTHNMNLIIESMPLDGRPKLFTTTLNSTGGMAGKTYYLYKQRIKELK